MCKIKNGDYIFIEHRKIYVSGKVSGLPYKEVQEKFKWHCAFLSLKGYDAVNPLDVCLFEDGREWQHYMEAALKALLGCDAIYLLKDWGQSKGARCEYALARELGLQIFFHGDFV